MEKKTYIAIIIAVVIILIIVAAIVWRQSKAPVISLPPITEETAPTPPTKPDSVSAINQELENININDLDAQFQEIDADLNKL